jgi:hypothetical protein
MLPLTFPLDWNYLYRLLPVLHGFIKRTSHPSIQLLFFISFTGAYSRGRTFGLPFRGFFITHIQTHGKTPLDEWSARRRDLYLHRTTQQTSMPRADFEPANQAAADLRLKPRGHWDRPNQLFGTTQFLQTILWILITFFFVEDPHLKF